MKRTYWVAIPILILAVAAGVFGSQMRADKSAADTPTSFTTYQPATSPSANPNIFTDGDAIHSNNHIDG